ncbi:hypothetical protein BV898_19245 [Hypsibius exemplaris]|uniref:Uncharacterized protein n=1 Tax=Hypsibius exemplaris TaxID=2072580 RepID=A0A9X6NIP3_HYPEX|nr:hypothetical protein BV898_19245 [Hypsibius exemplaris]
MEIIVLTARTLQAEYEKKIVGLGIQFEEDCRRRVRLVEDQTGKEVLEWKAECERSQAAHQQYIKLVDSRLEEHSKNIRDRCNVEMVQLNERIKTLETLEKNSTSETLVLQQKNTTKEAELKSANASVSSLQKKLNTLEVRLKENQDANETLVSEISILKKAKDPATIVRATLEDERTKLHASIEKEFEESSAASEARLKAKFQEQLEDMRGRHEAIVLRLTEHGKNLAEEAIRERMENQKNKMDFAEKKRTLEERLAGITSEMAVQVKQTEQKYQGNHKANFEALEAKQKASHSMLLRQHQEDQRDLLQTVGQTMQHNLGKEYIHEIQKLQLQIGDYERQRIACEESFKVLTAEKEDEHRIAIQTLERQLSQTNEQFSASQARITDLETALDKVKSQHQSLRDKLTTEVAAMMDRKDAEYRAMLPMVKESARRLAAEKLDAFQTMSASHVAKLEGQVEDFTKIIRECREAEQRVRGQLTKALQRNAELENSQAFIQRRLRQSEDQFRQSEDQLRQS